MSQDSAKAAHTSNHSVFTTDFIFKSITTVLLIASIAVASKAYFTATAHEFVTVNVSQIYSEFINAHARAATDQQLDPALGMEFNKALEFETRRLGSEGKVVLIGEAVVASDLDDLTDLVRERVHKKVPLPNKQLGFGK